jgi:predicted DNA-binding protein (UPF0278 family)
MASAGTPSILLQSQLIRLLSRQSATVAITKNIPTFIIMKTKQTYSLKIKIALFTGLFWP